MICESCGCTEARPCSDDVLGEPCSWVASGLCSMCATEDVESGESLTLPREDRSRPAPHYRERILPRRVA